MPMPEATMHEDGFTFADEGNVRISWNIDTVQPVAVTHPGEQLPNK